LHRTTLRLLALGAFALAALPAAANASISNTQITSPTGSQFFTYQADRPESAGVADPANVVTFAGTTDSTAPGTDKVRITCVTGYYSGGSYNSNDLELADGSGFDVSLAPDGTFSAAMNIRNAADNHGPCTFIAYPTSSGWSDSDIGLHFKGLKGFGDWWDPTNRSLGVAGGGTINIDYYVGHQGLLGGAEWDTADSCGPYYSNAWLNTLLAPPNTDLWDCAAWLSRDDYTGTRSAIRVGGKNAYLVDEMPQFDYDLGGPNPTQKPAGTQPIADPTYSRDAQTGEITVTESEPVQRCNADDYPATSTSCTSAVDTGLRLNRTLRTVDGGRTVSITDTWTNSTAGDQQLDVEYMNYIDAYDYPTLKFPGDDAFAVYGDGDAKTLPAQSTGTILARDSDFPDSIYQNAGYLTYGTQPDEVRWTNGYNTFVLHYARTIPANGSVTFRHAVGVARSTDTAAALGRLQEDTFEAPTVSISAPANGSTVKTKQVTVTGTAKDNVGVKSLTVNGQAVALGGDGSFSTPVTLNTGANTITAVATDGGGNSSQATSAVVYSPPAPPKCRVPKVRKGSTLSSVKKKLVKANCKVGKIKKATSKSVKKGRVISVSPKGVHAFQKKITIKISSGKAKAAAAKKSHAARRHVL
jgi:hypothetical protein